MKRIIISEIGFNLFVLKKMLISSFHILLPSSLSIECWRKLGFCLLPLFGSLLTIFNIDIVYWSFSLLFQEGELEIYVLNTVPVIIYLDVVYNKDKILNENRGKSGIYRWTNVNNKKSYMRSSSNLTRRFQCYLNTNYMLRYKSKSKIYSSLLKHGYNAFTLEIVEYCEKEELIIREQNYLDKLNPSYNILKIAGSSLGYTHSEQTKNLMSVNNTKEKHPFFL